MSKKWNFGMIGCGTIADFHMQAISKISHARLTAVSSRDAARAQQTAAKGNCAWTTDYSELIHRDDVDIVCLTTSSGSHAKIGLDVLRAGKHLVVEKPLAMTADECQVLINEATANKVMLSVISQRRFEPQHEAINRVLQDGKLGKLLLLEIAVPFYRTQAYYDSSGWRGTIKEDGGALMNQGIHSLDLLLWFGGEAKSVFGDIATQAHQMEAEDLGLAIVQFKNGARGTIMASTSIQPGFPASLRIYGEQGTIMLDGMSFTQWHVPGEEQPAIGQAGIYGGVSDPRSITFDYHKRQLMDIIEAIEQNREPLITGWDGLRTVQLIEAIYESANKGVRVEIQ